LVPEILPAKSGTYVLVLQQAKLAILTIGKAGTFNFAPGYYLYVGSAFGPGGLRARLGRHLTGSATSRWHIDYLRRASTPTAAWYSTSSDRCEHDWAGMLGGPCGYRPVAGFGASDCDCETHLFYSPQIPLLSMAKMHLQYSDITVTELASV
jgi:Uri superfamily endonuclease